MYANEVCWGTLLDTYILPVMHKLPRSNVSFYTNLDQSSTCTNKEVCKTSLRAITCCLLGKWNLIDRASSGINLDDFTDSCRKNFRIKHGGEYTIL